MKDIDEYRARYNEDPDGLVAKSVGLAGEDKEEMLIGVPLMHCMVNDPGPEVRVAEITSILGLYKGLFGPNFKPERDLKDVIVYVSVDKKHLSKEWQATLENCDGGFYKLTGEPSPQDDITKFIPEIVPIIREEPEDEE